MMKVNTEDTDSLFEKGFAEHPFISEKINFDIRYVSQKLFVFDIFTSLQNIY